MDSLFGRRQRRRRQRRTHALVLAIGAGVLLAFSSAGWAKQPAPRYPETLGLEGPIMHQAQKVVRPAPSEEVGVAPRAVPEIRLKALDTDALVREDALAERQGRVKILRTGVARDVQLSVQDGDWYDLAGGARLWIADVASTDAVGLRLHFKDVRLPAGAKLAVYAPSDGDPAHGVAKSGSSRFDPERRLELHTASAEQTEFWTGTVGGERARIEYLAPAGADSQELPFAVDSLQHLYIDPVDRLAKSLVGEKAAGSCNNDVTCFPEWVELSHAVSGINIIFGGGSGFCTGQLINNLSGDFTPFWLTANHCLDSPGEAGSAEFFWFYQTSACNGTPPSINSVPTSLGATLVSTNSQSDYTLLQVEGALPDGLFWAGWTSRPIGDGENAVAIHHPSADFKRISFGFKDEGSACSAAFPGRSLVRTSWTDGPTEPGSSGSGIFLENTGQLYGQLLGGPSACGNETFDCYGAFATTYTRVKNNLKAGTDDTSEQNDSCPKARVVKAGTLGGRIVKVNDTDWYRISVPAHKTVTVHLDFSNANGDIDLAAFANCASGAIAFSQSTEDSEEISLSNVGSKPAFAYWQVYLDSDTRNNYNMTTSVH